MRLERRRVLRLRLRDGAAASAFAAVALSGALPLPVTAVFVVALIVSLLDFRPFARRPALSTGVLLVTAAVLFGLVFQGALDLVIAAVSFASLVTAQRMLSDPGAATDQQVLLASLLLMAGGAALSGDIWYAGCLLAFGTFSCLCLGMAVVEGPVEQDEDLPLGPVMRSVSIGVGVALLGAIAFFILFPRLSWNVAARRTGPGLLGGTTGMTDTVRLGGGGDIKTSARVVFRVRIDPKPSGDRLESYWVGRHFDRFDGREWRGSGQAQIPSIRIMLGELNRTSMQRFELTPAYGSRTLVALEQPVLFGPATAITTNGSSPVQLVKVGDEEVRFADDANAYTYTAHSRADFPWRSLTGDERNALTSLPETLDPRVTALAQQIVGTETEPDRVARMLVRWLESNLAYTLELPGEVSDPLADFLFVRKQGHCEHFATALAVMLRTRGIPSRVVGGFYGGEWLGEKYVVRAGDAHAWVEAFMPTRGWQRFDATPSEGRGSQPPALLAQLTDLWEQVQELWRSRVIDYSIIEQWNFVRQLVRPPRGAQGEDEPAAGAPSRRVPTRAIVASVAVFVAVLLVSRRLAGSRSRSHPATDFLSQLEKRLGQLQVSLAPGETIETLPARLRREGHQLAEPVAAASRRYLEARFGGRPLGRDEPRALLGALHAPSERAPSQQAPSQQPPSRSSEGRP